MGEAEDHRRLDRHLILVLHEVGDGPGSRNNRLRVGNRVVLLQVGSYVSSLGRLEDRDGSIHTGVALSVPFFNGRRGH